MACTSYCVLKTALLDSAGIYSTEIGMYNVHIHRVGMYIHDIQIIYMYICRYCMYLEYIMIYYVV